MKSNAKAEPISRQGESAQNVATRSELAAPSIDVTIDASVQDAAGRRGFLRDSGAQVLKAAVGSLGVLGSTKQSRPRSEAIGFRKGAGIVRPPGAVEEDRFLELCDSCRVCAEVCEPNCVLFFDDDEGFEAGTPYILPVDRGCTLCMQCTTACPTGALLPLEAPADAIMGIAVIDESACVSHNGSGVCGACHTICPLRNRAITLDYRDAPRVDVEFCTGCGLCEEICFVEGAPAIRIFTERVREVSTAMSCRE